MRLRPADLVDLGMRLYGRAREDDVVGAAAELAFRFFLALFPFLIFLAALGGFTADVLDIRNPTQEIMDELGRSLPEDVESVLRKQLDAVIGSRDAGLVSFGIVATLFAAASGVGTVMKETNRAYGVRETRPLLLRWALALALTVFGGVLLVAAFVVFVVGQVAGVRIAEELGMGDAAARLFAFARWPAVSVVALTATSVLFWACPNVRQPFRWATPGGALFTLGWLLASWLFALYVARFGSYNETYGTLAGVVLVLLWFYISGLLLLLGAQLNALLDRLREEAQAASEAA